MIVVNGQIATKKQRRRQRRKRILRLIKAAYGCEECGGGVPAELDFHHRKPGKRSGGPFSCPGVRSAIEEMQKCDVLCKTCHKIEHGWKQQGSQG